MGDISKCMANSGFEVLTIPHVSSIVGCCRFGIRIIIKKASRIINEIK